MPLRAAAISRCGSSPRSKSAESAVSPLIWAAARNPSPTNHPLRAAILARLRVRFRQDFNSPERGSPKRLHPDTHMSGKR